MPNGTGGDERRHSLHPPFAQPDSGRRAKPQMSGKVAETRPWSAPEAERSVTAPVVWPASEPIPPIEQFVDDMPPIEDFLLSDVRPAETSALLPVPSHPRESASQSYQLETDSEGWAPADWQSYDWGGLASLGAPPPEAAEAHAAWTSTNWDTAVRGLRAIADRSTLLAEDEVAEALDEVARRIRSGELSLEQFRGTPPEAAIAAAFAALLRNRG